MAQASRQPGEFTGANPLGQPCLDREITRHQTHWGRSVVSARGREGLCRGPDPIRRIALGRGCRQTRPQKWYDVDAQSG